MPEHHDTSPPADTDPVTATAHLPGLDIAITHRRSPQGDAEHITIEMRAVPSFAEFGRVFEATNPFVFWAQAAQMMWSPWLAIASNMMRPANLTGPLARIAPRGHSIAPEQGAR